MKLALTLFSDLHREMYSTSNERHDWFFNFDIKPINLEGVDVVVLAGDIIGNNSTEFIERFCDRVPNVCFVCGNHEFYQQDFDDVLDKFRAEDSKRSNFHFLEQSSWTHESGQRFIGCTMWYRGDETRQTRLNDHRQIKHRSGDFTSHILKYSKDNVKWLEDNVQNGDVVVTHMLPSSNCISEAYRHNRFNHFYFNDADSVIMNNKPKLWLHGHSHQSYDAMLGATRVVRNPLGYPGEYNPEWQRDLRIVLDCL